MKASRLLLVLAFCFVGGSTAHAQLQVKCADSDGGLNVRREGEVTVTAVHNDRVLFQQSFRDRNWLSKKTYIEFYCDDKAEFPKYKIVDCQANESKLLPGGSCPSLEKGSIMMEARHASLQPKNIVSSEVDFRPYYALSVTAPVDTVYIKGLRLKVNIGGLARGNNTWVKFTRAGSSLPIGNTLLGWDQSAAPQATVLVRFNEPYAINVGPPQTFNLWLQGLAETHPNIISDNQIAVTIEAIDMEPDARMYYETKPQFNRFERQ